MRVHIGDNKLVIISELKTMYFDLPKDVGKNVKHKTDFIINHNEKARLVNECSNISIGSI